MVRRKGIKIFDDLHRFIKNDSKSDPKDVTLCCEDQDIDAHRKVLMAHSPYFSELLTNRPTENLVVALNKVDGVIFKYVLHFMYKGKVRVARDRMSDFKDLLLRFLMPIPHEVKYFLSRNITKNKHKTTHNADCEEFILPFQAILNTLNKTNVDKISHEFQVTHQKITAEQIDIIIRMVLQKVSNVSLIPVNLSAMAALMLAIQQTNSSNEFKNKLCVYSIGLFRNAFNYNNSKKPTAFVDSDKICALDKQVNLIENAHFYMASYRSCRIAHFIGHLYLVNLIEAPDICSIIELCEPKIESIDVSAVMRAMAIAFRRIHFEMTSDDDNRLSSLTHTQLQMLQKIVSRTKLIWAFSGETETCCKFQMSSDIRIILTSPWYTGIQSMVEHMNWTRFSAQQYFENDCKPMAKPEINWDL